VDLGLEATNLGHMIFHRSLLQPYEGLGGGGGGGEGGSSRDMAAILLEFVDILLFVVL
jgi:hypothetical protein